MPENPGTPGSASTSADRPVPECEAEALLGYVPPAEEVGSHRQFDLPEIRYPTGTSLESWGFEIDLKVDAEGRVACFSTLDANDHPVPMTSGQRQALLRDLGHWRYQPFTRDGQPVVAVVAEKISEVEEPPEHRKLPDVPLDQVRISLSRSGCYGSCPRYQVSVDGTGLVEYTGESHVDVLGKHSHRIPVAEVAKLVESLRSKDLWSLRESYRASITDHPTYLLEIRMGDQTHAISDYVGHMAGMPASVTAFQQEVDATTRSAMWTSLSVEGLEALRAERFDFKSRDAADLLVRTAANVRVTDDAAILALMALGAPLDGADVTSFGPEQALSPLLRYSLLKGRDDAVPALLDAGALDTSGPQGQERLDEAFRLAVMGSRLRTAQAVWNHAGPNRPALTFESASGDPPVTVRGPVTLLMNPYLARNGRWQGLPLARWLESLGADLKAKGPDDETLLHIATQAGDTALVRYLLDQGMDASMLGPYSLPALGSAETEDVALMLLEAGSDPAAMDHKPGEFRNYAVHRHWDRVVEWLDGKSGEKAARR